MSRHYGLSTIVVCLLTALFCGARASAQISTVAPPPTFANVVYRTVDGLNLALDVYLPTSGPGPFPVILYVHGGAYAFYDKTLGADDQWALSVEGFAVVSIDYRQSYQATWPAPLHDCKAAVRWIRQNAALYGFDAAHIGAFGYSSGAQGLTAMLAMSQGDPFLEATPGTDTSISSAIDCWSGIGGPYDFLDWQNYLLPANAWVAWELGGVLDPTGTQPVANGTITPYALSLTADPVNYATPDDPPCYLAHGQFDDIAYFEQSRQLFNALKQAGVAAELRIVPNEGHGLSQTEFARRNAFLKRKLMPSGVPFPATLTFADPLVMNSVCSVTVDGVPGTIAYLFVSARPDYLPLGAYGNLLIPFEDYANAGAGILDATGHFTVSTFFPLVPTLEWQTLNVQGLVQSAVYGGLFLTDLAVAHIEL